MASHFKQKAVFQNCKGQYSQTHKLNECRKSEERNNFNFDNHQHANICMLIDPLFTSQHPFPFEGVKINVNIGPPSCISHEAMDSFITWHMFHMNLTRIYGNYNMINW